LSHLASGRYNPRMPPSLTDTLLDWYGNHARDLPWRRTGDPYAIWVAEVMLQQTRVETVLPYYRKWMARFPNPKALAEASSDELMSAWEGLGYYRRAHNMHLAAEKILREHAGQFPQNPEDLRNLPGVGKYTAAAVGAIAFGADVVALDGNLRRVLARLMDLDLDPRSVEGEARLLGYATSLLPEGRASAFNQALMDLGATICLPRRPACDACPIAGFCRAKAAGAQMDRPVRGARAGLPSVRRVCGVLPRQRSVLIGRRPLGGLLGGLWEFPGGDTADNEDLEVALRRQVLGQLGVRVEDALPLGVYRHSYTHFQVTAHAFICAWDGSEPTAFEHTDLRWADVDQLAANPMGKIDRTIARDLKERAEAG